MASVPIDASAYESLIGEFTGNLQKVEGTYRGTPGTPCLVKIAQSDMFGGSLSFAINDEPPMLYEIRNIAAAQAGGASEIMLSTPNTGERLKLKTRPDGAPVYILLKRVSSKKHTTDTLACEALTRK
jgi:hypothetical protein